MIEALSFWQFWYQAFPILWHHDAVEWWRLGFEAVSGSRAQSNHPPILKCYCRTTCNIYKTKVGWFPTNELAMILQNRVSVACVASVSVWFPCRFQCFEIFALKLRWDQKKPSFFFCSRLNLCGNPMETLATQARVSVAKSVPFASCKNKVHIQNKWDSKVNWICL